MNDSREMGNQLPRSGSASSEGCRIPFLRRRWAAAFAGQAQASVMMSTGLVLLSQLHETPRLALQMSIVGGLLVIFGVTSLLFVLRDLFGFIRVDKDRFSARVGITKFSVMWDEIAKWRINEVARTPEVACVELWCRDQTSTHRIPGGMISEEDLLALRQWCRAFAGDKE